MSTEKAFIVIGKDKEIYSNNLPLENLVDMLEEKRQEFLIPYVDLHKTNSRIPAYNLVEKRKLHGCAERYKYKIKLNKNISSSR